MAMVTVNETQSIYVRQLLFEELHDVCEMLARQVNDAATGSDIAGEDALGTFKQRLTVVAGLLNTVGWATDGDQARVVELERQRCDKAVAR
jgi:hypothetical protein